MCEMTLLLFPIYFLTISVIIKTFETATTKTNKQQTYNTHNTPTKSSSSSSSSSNNNNKSKISLGFVLFFHVNTMKQQHKAKT